MVGYYWGGAMVGRFIGSYLLRISARVRSSQRWPTGAIVLIAISANTTGTTSAYSLLAIGLMNSIMFPTIFSLACEKLGPRAADGSGIINIAIFGGAVVPLADRLPGRQVGQPALRAAAAGAMLRDHRGIRNLCSAAGRRSGDEAAHRLNRRV